MDPDRNLIQMSAPLRSIPVCGDLLFPDLRCKHWSDPIPPGMYRPIADFDAAFVEHIFNLPQRLGEADKHHDHQTDGIGRSLETTDWISRAQTLRNVPRRVKPVCSDIAVGNLERGANAGGPTATRLCLALCNKAGFCQSPDVEAP